MKHESVKVKSLFIEESKVNKGMYILIVIASNGEKFVMAGDQYYPTYLTPYDKSFDTKLNQ